jgi:ParB-like chromosome segregation protein Spo0J
MHSDNALDVEWRPVGEVFPYERNPRVIPESAILKVAASIREFGWRQPIVVDAAGVVLVGHTRLLAAKHLGLETVPVHVAKGLTPAQAKAYRLADNRVGEETSWALDVLGVELQDLKGEGFDLAPLGFDLAELEGPTERAKTKAAAERTLMERFGIAPFSVLNAREGWWQERKRAWLAIGIQSELGRGDNHLQLSDTVLAAVGGKRR